jgi:ribosome-binding factor A
MATRRQRQVAELLHQEISRLIQYRTQDPRLGFVTVTGVDVTPDLRQARVHVSVLGDKQDVKETLTGLASAAKFFRHELGQTLTLRYIPELSFKLDKTLDHALHIDNLLDKIDEQRAQTEPSPENPTETNHNA